MSDLKKKWMSDLRLDTQINKNHDIRMADPPETRKTLSDLENSGKNGENETSHLKKPGLSDPRWKGNIDIKRRYSDARELGDGC